ncbi:unnamed protein product [Clonostachys chloroleuca]|uniref:Uncharacterized protein n=1 Tax=Clonostachys chloroleuca TaxID=1926264 RepID=A0AA35QD11_9HYPO|nr:unnamed protein product [Clonostachys chloroleuca]
MLTFLRDHNYKVTQHLTTNLMLASMVMMTSVFSYGFENSVLSTIQAMTVTDQHTNANSERRTRRQAKIAGVKVHSGSVPSSVGILRASHSLLKSISKML